MNPVTVAKMLETIHLYTIFTEQLNKKEEASRLICCCFSAVNASLLILQYLEKLDI